MPIIRGVASERRMITEFQGYNHNPSIAANEFYDMHNMSGDNYPLLSPRRRRARIRALTKPNGLYAHNKLCWVDGTDFYYGGTRRGAVSDSQKQLIGMGAYILVWPDKAYYNTHTDEFGSLAQTNTASETVTITLSKRDGTAYSDYTTSDTAPTTPTDGQLWIDTSMTPNRLKQYAATYGTWNVIATTYVRISATGIGTGLSQFDGVTISGLMNDDLNGDFLLEDAEADYIIITAIISATFTQTAAVTVERKIPDMDFVTEFQNRIWGCSSENHEVYACKLGDPKNWNTFMGLSTDSYAATVGTPGDFTGACTHMGRVFFFKEDVIHEVQGYKPSNFTISDTACRGVEKGSERSIAIVNETLYYKSRSDICAFAAALPISVSRALGATMYKNAVAGHHGSKYYVSLEDESNTSHLFVFDETRGFWHREDNTKALWFAALDGDLYFINAKDNCLYSVNGTISEYADANAALEKQLSWSAETGTIGLDSPDNKYLSRIQLRCEIDLEAVLRADVAYPPYSAWQNKGRTQHARLRSRVINIIPRRADHARLRVYGTGKASIHTLTYTITPGSEV